ncbi:MAG: DUF4435 domain-containing protein [Paludibacter sp.]|nr:DUF4435 domain-containing protein [Paludibacter sp.]
MTPKLNEKKHFESKANYFASIADGTVFNASIHLEDRIDEVFWKPLFNAIFPDSRFNFIFESDSIIGNKTSGCEQCLKYKDYLSKRFFICIDSDYRYLLQESNISAANFIFQTYTYSIENHLCYASKLNAVPEQCTGVENVLFDFENFLLQYSNALYEAYSWHLYFIKRGDSEIFSKEDFNKILSLNGMPDFNINNNGSDFIKELTARCNSKVAELKSKNHLVDIEPEQMYFESLGLTRDNTYLYIRGHNLFDLIVKIGKQVNDALLLKQRFKMEMNGEAIAKLYAQSTKFEDKLKEEIVFEGYPEIEKIKHEIRSILI